MPLLFLGFAALGIYDLCLSFVGLQASIGIFFTLISLGIAFFFRTSIVIVIGSYLGAVNVLGWPWWGGVLIACPGLLFVLPHMVNEFLSRAQ
ncbi:hypothetical protein GS501_06575 [Saccharibacter sp. 17.LH.SD]|uniref:hypothetical protein n=1 Tax=Saccharibacter sp. 17.LH.SD TaxID=2689393 RepID=UPI00136FB15F|nr:hypothetical protein [Saccharibacter sp. 17.LH.SD]MXV44707.1 hypothetical protein [Saccharibacter sp. 17.LH.SD]